MTISTIKTDESDKPKGAKYGIVALGNLDPVHWHKDDTYALVMSLIELCLLTDIAVRNKYILKNRDVKQAFFKATLPKDEVYVVCPPIKGA